MLAGRLSRARQESVAPRAGVAGVLALRGLAGFVDGRLRPDSRAQPFYALNRRIYSPLCLALATAIVVVLACRA